ncbi:UNVERIFIED_CONTAM: hypothetical protein Slati_3428400 [Sesamum latifolium]|uniref:Uncharacterized protein n=1 Tax=Sesamum latifolium TaxID=2727402 RepID=A0AAW2UIB3_9LAMI
MQRSSEHWLTRFARSFLRLRRRRTSWRPAGLAVWPSTRNMMPTRRKLPWLLAHFSASPSRPAGNSSLPMGILQ